jgi:hypothetical protein
LGMVVHTCHCGPGQPGINTRPYLKNSQSTKIWREGSSGGTHKDKALSLNPSTSKKKSVRRSLAHEGRLSVGLVSL